MLVRFGIGFTTVAAKRTTESPRRELLLWKELVTGPKIVGDAKPQYVINDGSPHVPGLQLFDNLEGCLYRFKKDWWLQFFSGDTLYLAGRV